MYLNADKVANGRGQNRFVWTCQPTGIKNFIVQKFNYLIVPFYSCPPLLFPPYPLLVVLLVDFLIFHFQICIKTKLLLRYRIRLFWNQIFTWVFKNNF